jgi:hypothetical protein
MAFREVSVVQVKEALRRWLKGEGERPIAQGVGIDRKTVRRYIAAAIELGVDRNGNEDQLSDELIGQVVEQVRPHRPDGHGAAWRSLLAAHSSDSVHAVRSFRTPVGGRGAANAELRFQPLSVTSFGSCDGQSAKWTRREPRRVVPGRVPGSRVHSGTERG